MIIAIYGIFLASHAQNFAYLVKLDVIIVALRVEVGQGFLQTITMCRTVIFVYNLVSSAYIASEEPPDIASERSFMKIAKSIGPKILPCGTPEITRAQPDGTPSTTTLWVRQLK